MVKRCHADASELLDVSDLSDDAWDSDDDDDDCGVTLNADGSLCSEPGDASDVPPRREQQQPPPAAPSEAEQDGTDGGRRTAAWYRERADWKLYDGAQLTVMQAAFVMLSMKHRHQMKNCMLNELLRLLAEELLPDGNLMVPSVYLLKAVTGCAQLIPWHAPLRSADCRSA